MNILNTQCHVYHVCYLNTHFIHIRCSTWTHSLTIPCVYPAHIIYFQRIFTFKHTAYPYLIFSLNTYSLSIPRVYFEHTDYPYHCSSRTHNLSLLFVWLDKVYQNSVFTHSLSPPCARLVNTNFPLIHSFFLLGQTGEIFCFPCGIELNLPQRDGSY